MILKQFFQSIIYHYMDDILLPDADIDILERIFDEVNQTKPNRTEQDQKNYFTLLGIANSP